LLLPHAPKNAYKQPARNDFMKAKRSKSTPASRRRRIYTKVDWVYLGLVILIFLAILSLAYELYLAP